MSTASSVKNQGSAAAASSASSRRVSCTIAANQSYHWNPYDTLSPTVAVHDAPSASDSGASSAATSQRHLLADTDLDGLDLIEGAAIIADLRRETRDSHIQVKLSEMLRAGSRKVECVKKALAANPPLMRELCEKERGNVVSHIIAVLGSEHCSEIADWAILNTLELSVGQSGCVAVTRIYDALSLKHQEQLALKVMNRFVELSLDTYGNYVIQGVLKRTPPGGIASLVADNMCVPATISALIRSKSGSHVVETFVKCGDRQSVLRYAALVLRTDSMLQTMAFDSIGNYVLQSTLRFACSAQCPDQGALAKEAHQIVPQIAEGSPYMLNLLLSLGIPKVQAIAMTNRA